MNIKNLIDPEKFTRKQKQDGTILYDMTEEFLDVLKSYSPKEGFGIVMWIIGTFGSGKSVLLMMLAWQLYISSKGKRRIVLFRPPEKMLKTIYESVPEDHQNAFVSVERLDEVRSFDILCIDEGILNANAKRALHKDSENFKESLITLRHSSVITILNAQDDGILRGFRTIAQVRFYKTLTTGFIEETPKMKFIKNYKDLLTKHLKVQHALFEISHQTFINKRITEGVIIMDYHDYFPWWNEDMSRSFDGEDFDARLRREKKIMQRAEQVIQLLGNTFGPSITNTFARGFLRDNHPQLFLEFEPHLKDLVAIIKTRFALSKFNKQKYYDKESVDLETLESSQTTYQRIMIPNFEKDMTFQEFLLEFYRKNLTGLEDKEREYQALILHDWSNGLSQRAILENRGGNSYKINQVVKRYRSGIDLANDELRICYILEHYCALKTDGKRVSGIGKPDIMYFENVKELGPGEVKVVQPSGKSITLHLFSKNMNHHTLNPSYEYCLKNGLKRFPLFYFWPKWGESPMMIPVKMPQFRKSARLDYTITLLQEDYEEYKLDFNTFNKFTYFHSRLRL